MKGIFKFLSNMILIGVFVGFIYYFVKLLFHPKYWWIGWLWIILAFAHYYTYESDWPSHENHTVRYSDWP